MTTHSPSEASRPPVSRHEIIVVAILLVAILGSRFHSYILFHTLVEMFGICVGLTAFSVAWNTRRHLDDGFLRVLGLAMGPLAIISMLHMIAYRGMGVFPEADANLPTQLWVAVQILRGAAMFAATMPVFARQEAGRIVVICTAIAVALISLIFVGLFPDCFVASTGLTPFKVAAEYLVMGVLAIAALRIWQDHTPRDPKIKKLAISALLVGCLEGAAFTFYTDVYGAFNMVGHMLGLIHAVIIYIAVAWTGLVKPQEVLYGQLHAAKNSYEGQANRSSRDIIRFSEVLAHHLQEPIRIQSIFSDKVQKLIPETTTDVKECLDYIRNGSRRMIELMSDVQRYLAACREDPSGSCSAELALKATLARMSGSLQAVGATIHHNDKLPMVKMKQESLEEIMSEILTNAISFKVPARPLIISINSVTHGDYLTVSIRDNGAGIDGCYFNKIFDVFEQTSGQNWGAGTGIGLAIVRRLVESANGKISVDSVIGEWTEFCIDLPVSD
jgi:signal transduction histidine kinase